MDQLLDYKTKQVERIVYHHRHFHSSPSLERRGPSLDRGSRRKKETIGEKEKKEKKKEKKKKYQIFKNIIKISYRQSVGVGRHPRQRWLAKID